MPSLRFRVQEALAERFRSVQFPRERGIEQSKWYVFLFGRVQPREPYRFWATPMPFWRRIVIGGLSLTLLFVGLILATFVGSFIYAFVSALVSS